MTSHVVDTVLDVPSCCRQLNERGQYRLQSEDGSTAAVSSQSSDVAEGKGSESVEPLSDLLSVGQAAVQSLKPDAAEADELAQLVTPLVLGGSHVHPQSEVSNLAQHALKQSL